MKLKEFRRADTRRENIQMDNKIKIYKKDGKYNVK